MDKSRFTDGIDETLVYLRLLACLEHSGFKPTTPMVFHICASNQRATTTTDLRLELTWRTLKASWSPGLTLEQGKQLIGLLNACRAFDCDYTAIEVEYERLRVHCLWLYVQSMLDGSTPVHPKAIEYCAMVQHAMRLSPSYGLCAAGLVAKQQGHWKNAADLWKRARDEFKHPLAPFQVAFLERYDAGIYTRADVPSVVRHTFVPINHKNNPIFRQGTNPTVQCTFSEEQVV